MVICCALVAVTVSSCGLFSILEVKSCSTVCCCCASSSWIGVDECCGCRVWGSVVWTCCLVVSFILGLPSLS